MIRKRIVFSNCP